MSAANASVVTDFLDALALPDTERALSLLDPDVEWLNTGLPTIRGRRVHAVVRDMERRRIGFGVTVHSVAANGDTVLTDRTDRLAFGRVRTEFWVCGTFTVRNGLITRWDDHFSMGNFAKGFVSGTLRALRAS
jgi:limonene-1,2-epoxide hydrolase